MRRPTGILLFAVVALLSLASLAELRVTGAQTPAGESAFLQPGLNWVGWLGEERSVQDLFDAVPDLKSVWVWDAYWQDWSGASREPSPGRELTEVHPGMALWMWIDGSHPVRWPYGGQSPATGLVELHRGENYVTWGGPGFDLAQVVYDGVGISLEDVMVWRSGEARWQELDPWNRVARGDVLWVKVARDVNWLQPTGEWPDVVFADEDSLSVKEWVDRDLNAAMTFFAEEWGVQADHSRTKLYVATDGDALARVIPKDYPCRDVRKTWAEKYEIDRETSVKKYAAWHCGGHDKGHHGVSFIVLRGEWWVDDDPNKKDDDPNKKSARIRNMGNSHVEGRYQLIHEYTHAVQHQLSGEIGDHPTWLVEGTAFWTEGLLYVDDQELAGYEHDRDWLRRDNERRFSDRDYNSGAPPLASLEDAHAESWGEYKPWRYELGTAAVERLAGSAERGRHERQASILEYWRQYDDSVVADLQANCGDAVVNDEDVVGAVVCLEPEPWKDAFEQAFSLDVDSFYAEFRAWRTSILE